MRGKFLMAWIGVAALSACSQSDMQGVNPQDYYAEHPVKNTIETRHMLYTLDFNADRSRLSGGAIDDLQSALSDISPDAVESVTVKLAPSQMSNTERRRHITKLLRMIGYDTKIIRFEAAKETRVREAALDIAYASVIPPHCPDWRTSPVTNYSNTYKNNIGCASTVNLGVMIADPHDLVKGNSDTGGSTQISIKALQNYHSGDLITTSSGTANSGSGGAGTGSETGQ